MVSHNSEAEDQRIVISGISGRFPNSDNVAELQYNLLNKIDCTTVDHDRWEDFESEKIPQRLGVFNDVTRFDRVFFGVHAKLTPIMDPVSRIMLEHSFEAIMDAGINPRKLKGANVAVYTATSIAESEKSLFNNKGQQSGFGMMGSSKAMLPNRISFFLGLNGSSINIDNGEAGSGTALEKAYYDIKTGLCDAAIVAGSSQCLHPHVSYQLRELGLLSADGLTRCFDDNADGHTRSEAITVLYLQRAKDAKRIYMEIVNTQTVHANSIEINTVLYPTMEPQVKLMKELLTESKLTPDDISYVEASGIAIKDFDAEELNAIDVVYGKRKKPLPIGSVKSIIGDTVAANTVASIIKMIVASETGQIPPNANYEKPNSKAPCLTEKRLVVPKELTPWTGQYSVVHTSSINGTISSTILKVPNIEKKNNDVPNDDIPRLVMVSGRTEEAIETFLNYMEERPLDAGFLQLLYDIFQSDIDGHLYRGYSIIPAKGLVPIDSKKREVLFNTGEKKEVWWVFSGMGSQWVGMGEALLKLPTFEASIKKCDAVLKPHGYDIFKVITDKNPKMFDQIINSFIGIAAIQIGLVDVLKAVGLEPDYIIGHSVGELGCAYADGCFTAEQMIMAALSRGLASTETKLEKGSMAAVGLGYADVKPLCPPDIDIACHNGPESTTISGPDESMKKFVAHLTAKGIFAREIPCSNIAYHSRYIAAAAPKLLERLQKVIPKPNSRSSKWVSTSVRREEWNTLKARLCSAEYHTNNLLSPVLFDETSRLIPPNAVCVEIAPHGLLQAILKKSLPDSCINISLTRRGHPDNLELLLTALGKLYNIGLHPQIANLYPKVQYPVGRGTPSISSLVKWDHTAEWFVNFYTPTITVKKEGGKTLEINLNEGESQYLQGNVIDGKFVVPLSLCLFNAWEILKSYDTEKIEDIIFEEIKIHKPLLEVPDDNIVKLTIMILKGTKKFEVMDSETFILSGLIKTTKTPQEDRLSSVETNNFEEKSLALNQEDFYTEMEMKGYQYSKDFKGVTKASIDGTNALIKWDNNWITYIDSALQLFIFGNDLREVQVPLLIRKIIIDHNLQETASKSSNGIKTCINKKFNYLSSGGLEIQGPKFTVIPKNLEQNKISNDVFSVVPNIDKSNISLNAILRVILQIILENTLSDKIQKVELIENNYSQDIYTLKNLMNDIPEATFFKTVITSYKKAKFNKALTIITDDVKNNNLKDISQKLGNSKFLLSIINNDQEDLYINTAESVGLRVVLLRKHENESIILLKKKQALNIQIFNASENIKDTINKIKKMYIPSENGRVIVVIKTENLKYAAEYIDQIQEVLNLDKIRIFNIQNTKVSDSILEKLCTKQSELDLLINVLTLNNVWATLRLTKVTLKPKLSKHWIANQKHSNDPFSIIWTEGPIIEKTENLVKVEYSALNVQDILIANRKFFIDTSEVMGKNRLTQKSIGLEFSGIDLKGNRIMGITNGNSMSNVVSADPEWTWQIPKSWSFEDAATVPLSYITAFTALFIKAQVQVGEKVLLSNVCNDLGLAILNLAVNKKCDVLVTYDTEAEKKLIQSIAPNLPNNRLFKFSGDSFRDNILLQTHGQGVDVIISNYCEIKKIEVFFTITNHNARVISINDLSDNQIHENIGLEIFLKQVRFYSVVPRKILSCHSETKKNLANMLRDGITNGSIRPLPRIIYTRDSLSEAFNACIARQHLGKILVKVQLDGSNADKALTIPRFYCSKNKSYVLIDGLTQFGLELMDWLITRGARHFVVTSTLKNDSGYQNLRIKLWQNYGVQIIVRKDFNPTNQNIKTLFNDASAHGPVDAVFDLQRVSDASVKSVTLTDNFNSTTKIIDDVTRSLCRDLRLLVICSAFINPLVKKLVPLDALNSESEAVNKILEQRKKDNLPGLFIKWGVTDNKKERVKKDDHSNVVLPPLTKYLQKLDEILGTEENIVQVSYVIPPINEIDEDVEDITTLNPVQKDAQQFSGSLYEQNASFSYIQV